MPRRRRLTILFAALLAVLAAAPGAHATGAEDRVGAFLSTAGTHTGPDGPRTPSSHQGTSTPGAGIAAGCCVAAKRGADDVADDFVVVRGGTKEMPPPGETFSGAAGRTLDEAASGVPHGQIRATTAREIHAAGGTVTHAPELTRSGVLNPLHVNICRGRGPCPFGPLQPNPVPKSGRIR